MGKLTEQERVQLEEKNNSRNKLAESLIKEYDEYEEGFDLENLYDANPSKAINTAIAIDNQRRYLDGLTETVISSNFHTKPENLLKVVRIGVANSNRGDFATEYQLQTTDDAFYHIDMTYEKSLRGATAGEKIYEKVNPYYAGEQVVGTVDGTGASASYSITLSTPKPVVPFSVRVLVGGAVVGNDNGSGQLTFTGQNTGAANTIDYTTGAVVMNFTGAPGAKIELLYNWNSEDSTLYDQFGTVGIALRKTRFNARPMPLGYSYTNHAEITLRTTGIGNAEELLVGTVGDEHAKARDYKAIARMRQIALLNTQYTFDTDFTNEGEFGDKAQAQKIMSKIREIGADIYDDIKRGQINKAIAGSKALVYLMKHDRWVDDNSQAQQGVYKAGKLGNIDVFSCPADSALVASDEIILTWKNPQEQLDVGIVFGVLTEIYASLQYPEFYKVGNVASVEDSQVINSKFIRLLKLENL